MILKAGGIPETTVRISEKNAVRNPKIYPGGSQGRILIKMP